MNKNLLLKYSLYFTAIVSIAIWALLVWSHYHGGVPRHHLLARKDLPSFSNWWGGIILPLLTWFLLYRIRIRVLHENVELSKFPVTVLYGFTAALLFGIMLSVFFTFGYSDIPGYMLMGLFLLALFIPVYRAECLLGFVIGMTFTFGAVLPTLIGSVLTLITALLYLYIRPSIRYIAAAFLRMVSSGRQDNSHK